MATTVAMGVPAYRSFTTFTQSNGTTISLCLCGDEFNHYYMDADGNKYERIANGDFQRIVDYTFAETAKRARRNVASVATRASGNVAEGQVRGLVILADFSDRSFYDDANATWTNRLNSTEVLDAEHPSRRSAREYFLDQSQGKFDITFDVVGPVQLTKSMYYYGENENDWDAHAGEMVAEACLLADEQVDFSTYDWNGDGEAEMVFVLYAGCGEYITGYDERLVWPHQYYLSFSDYGTALTLDGTKVNNYACASEMFYDDSKRSIQNGIGTFCHEFSHCLGLPDLYPSTSAIDYIDEWSILSGGCYNDNGWTPCNYTAYERDFLGWQSATVLNEPTSVTAMQSLSDYGDTYKIVNDGHTDEYYLIENRQLTGWDEHIPGAGMLIYHVDYRASVWYNNTVNDDANHQRLTIFRANNSKSAGRYNAYPYVGETYTNNELTDTSTPAATLYNANANGEYFMSKPITNIVQNADGTMSFDFMGGTAGIDAVSLDAESIVGQPAKVYDIAGRMIFATQSFSLESLPQGVYVVRVGEKAVKIKRP